MISVGDKIPDVQVMATGLTPVRTGDLFSKGKIVVFAVPGAFTPTCSDYHLPGFVLRGDEFRTKGVDHVYCISVNDAFVMEAWGRDKNVGTAVVMLADGNAEFTSAMGLTMDGTGFGLGTRSRRYAMIIEDGVVTALEVEPDGGLNVSSAEAILKRL